MNMLRIHEGDGIYMLWWIALIGTIVWLLVRIERNTRGSCVHNRSEP